MLKAMANNKKTIFKLLFAALLVVLFALFIGMATKTSAAEWSYAYTISDGDDVTATLSADTTLTKGILVESGGKLTINATAKCTLSRSSTTATYYMIVCRPGGTIVINGNNYLTIKGNTTTEYAVNPIVAVQGSVTLNKLTLSDNYTSTSTANVGGGAIKVWDFFDSSDPSQTLTIDGCTISNCDTSTHGGAIALGNSGRGTVAIKNTTITGCDAANNGGALGVHKDAAYTVTLSGTNDFYSNKAHQGGAIYWAASSGSLTISAGTYQKNYINNTTVEDPPRGGALCMSAGTVTINGTTKICSNNACLGGGIYMSGGTLTVSGSSQIYSNAAYPLGGGFYVKGGTLKIQGTCKIYGNDAASEKSQYRDYDNFGSYPYDKTDEETKKATNGIEYGGAIFINGGTVTMTGGTIGGEDNYETHANKAFRGSAVYMASGTFNANGGTISYNKQINSAGNVNSQNGSGVYMYSGTLKIGGTDIIYNTSATSGAGVFVRTGTFEMSAGSVSNNTALSNNGGGIYFESVTGTAKIYGSAQINGNTAVSFGGGVYINSGTYEIYGSAQINNNTLNDSYAHGGGVYMAVGTVTLKGSAQINGNKANNGGGGIWIQGTAGNTTAIFNMSENAQISNNTMQGYLRKDDYNFGDSWASYGGGVYLMYGTFNMSGGKISGNQAYLWGGGVEINQGIFNLSGTGEVSGNTLLSQSNITLAELQAKNAGVLYVSPCAGGGFFIASGGTLNMSGGSIHGNEVDGAGGGIWIRNGHFTMSGGAIYGNELTNNVDYPDAAGDGFRYSPGCGAGIYIREGSITLSEDSTASIYGNTAPVNGGGIYVENGDVTISGGSVGQSGEANTAVLGGGVYLEEGDVVINGGYVQYNTASNNGGGIYMQSGTFSMSGGSIDGNTADISGGGIYMDNGSFSMTGGTISNNVSNASSGNPGGGGIFIRNASATVTVSGANTQIYGNSAVMSGGGIFLHTGNFELTDAMIGGDTADKANSAKWGGGIYVHAGNFRMYSGSIKNNTSTDVGAGVCLWGNNVTFIMDSGLISENKATVENGGGVYLNNGSFTMNDGTISKNTTVKNGGGVYVANGEFIMNDGLIQANVSVHGGGVYVASGTFDMLNGDINSNDASGNGGGVYVAGNFTMSGGQIGGGTASAAQNGGGVYVLNGSFTLSGDGKIAENSASGNGGGVYFNSPDKDFTLNSSNAYIQNNSADNSGGGVFLEAGNFIMVIGNISSNQCADKGGAIYIEKGNFNMTDGTVSGNTTTGSTGGGNGGAIYVRRGNFTMSNGTISGNTAAKNGGAVYVWTYAEINKTDPTIIDITNSEITISGGTITNNKANQGGAFYIHGGDLTVTGGSFTNNTANFGGGAIYIFEDRYYISQSYGGNEAFVTKVNVQSGTFTGNVTKKEQGGAIAIWLVKGSKANVIIGVQDCNGETPSNIQNHTHPVFQNNVAEGASCGGIYISKDTIEYRPKTTDEFLLGVYTEADLSNNFESYASLSIFCGDITGNDGNLKEDVNLLIENGVVVLAGAANLGTEGIILSGGTLTLEHGFDASDLTGIMVTGGTLQMEDSNGNILPNVTLTFIIDWDGDGEVDITETASVPSNFPLRLPSYDKNDLTTIAWYTDNVNDYEMVETTFELTASTTYTAIVNYWGHGIRLDPLTEAEKNYNNVEHTDDITVNNDSAFTVEFAIHYMEASKFGDRVLSFATAPAAGTTILLIDKTYAADKNIVKYYYYTFTGGETEVDLTSFKQLGTGTAYTILEATYTNEEEDYVSETLTFIFDLADTTTTTGAFDITFTVKSADGNDAKDTVHSESVTLAAKRTFTLSESDSTISYETTATGGSGDSRYSGKEYSIVVSAQNGTIPKDMFLTVGGNKYYLNKNGYFIIPLGNATSADVLMAAKSLSANGLGLELTATLWASENDVAPFMGEPVASVGITFTQTALPTFTINDETSDRTVTADGTLTVNFEKTNVTGNVTVEIQKKSGGNYADVAGAAVTVNGSSFTVTANSLDLGASGYETYRAVITVNGIDVIYYNFIVIID